MDNQSELEKKKAIMAATRARMQARSDETLRIRQERVANAIHGSIAEAAPAVSVEEARRRLADFGPIEEVGDL